jgi:hypothetical protein
LRNHRTYSETKETIQKPNSHSETKTNKYSETKNQQQPTTRNTTHNHFRRGPRSRLSWAVVQAILGRRIYNILETYGFLNGQHRTLNARRQWFSVENRFQHQQLVGETTFELRSFNLEQHFAKQKTLGRPMLQKTSICVGQKKGVQLVSRSPPKPQLPQTPQEPTEN